MAVPCQRQATHAAYWQDQATSGCNLSLTLRPRVGSVDRLRCAEAFCNGCEARALRPPRRMENRASASPLAVRLRPREKSARNRLAAGGTRFEPSVPPWLQRGSGAEPTGLPKRVHRRQDVRVADHRPQHLGWRREQKLTCSGLAGLSPTQWGLFSLPDLRL